MVLVLLVGYPKILIVSVIQILFDDIGVMLYLFVF
jgi:hypothetical protein